MNIAIMILAGLLGASIGVIISLVIKMNNNESETKIVEVQAVKLDEEDIEAIGRFALSKLAETAESMEDRIHGKVNG